MKSFFDHLLRISKVLRYGFSRDYMLYFFAILILFIALRYFTTQHAQNIEIGTWTNVIDPIITLLTVSITLLVYFSNAKRDWENQLPKKLTVHFIHQDKYVMSCIHASLTGESDIRQYGQQIGSQIASDKPNEAARLKFFPYMTIRKQIINQEYYEYTLIIYLSEKNEKCKDNYIVWIDNDDTTPENIELICGEHPTYSYDTNVAIEKHNAIIGNKKVIFKDGKYQYES